MIERSENKPRIHPTAYVAESATVCGDVRIGPNSRIMHGARIVAEGKKISLGEYCIVLENAVVRSTARFSTEIGNNCLIGPNAHIVGCQIDDEVFIATGASVFHGAILERNSEVRINGVVHLKTRLSSGQTVPIGWVAIGDPASILSPDKHDEIWKIQESLNFPKEVYGCSRGESLMKEVTEMMSDSLKEPMKDEPA